MKWREPISSGRFQICPGVAKELEAAHAVTGVVVPPPAPAGGFCQPCKPGGGAQRPNVLGMSMIERQEYLRQQRAKPPAAVSPRARARFFAAIGVAVLAAGLAWRPTAAAAASVVLVAASCAFIT